MLVNMRKFLFMIMLILALTVVGCSRSNNVDDSMVNGDISRYPMALEVPASGFARASVGSEEKVLVSQPMMVESEPALAQPPVPVASQRIAKAVSESDDVGDTGASFESHAQLVSLERIIVRTVDVTIVVKDVQATVAEVATIAKESGGWVVSTNRIEKHRGFISFRVPADSLEAVTFRIRGTATEVKTEVSESRDVTDEYFDLGARLNNQKATQDVLLQLMERSETVEDALNVQQTLTEVQEEIERIQGKIKLLGETAAFSLVRVNLELEPQEMTVEEIADKTTGVGENVRFRAFFKPPNGIDQFNYTWDFGDGDVVSGYQTAPTEKEGTRVTATVTHSYRDERDSPFIAQLDIRGSGEAGVSEGEATVMVNVTRVPNIVVFAGERVFVDEGEVVKLSGSFTRPPGLGEVGYRWEFGDGSEPATGKLGSGITIADSTHTYEHHRPFPYHATLTIMAESEAGDVEASSSVTVMVEEIPSWIIGGWSLSDHGKTAVRALSAVGQGVLTVLVWVAIFSPAWLAVGFGGYWLVRRLRKRRQFKSIDIDDDEDAQVEK